MQIDLVMDVLYKKYHLLRTEANNPSYVPRLEIYMDYDFYAQCKGEIQGKVSSGAYEFSRDDLLMGFPVWKVVPSIREGEHHKHKPFVVVNLDA